MEPLIIVLIVLVIAAIWLVVELVKTLRKARTALDEISHSATELIDQATPLVVKADGIIDDLQPAINNLNPMTDKLNVVLDEATISIDKVNGILGDVSSTTHGVAGVGESASRIVNTATSAAVGVVSKVASLGGITIPEGQQLIGKGTPEGAEQAQDQVAATEPAPEPARKTSYVTYAPVTSESDSEE